MTARNRYQPYPEWSPDIRTLYAETQCVCPYCGLDGRTDYRIRRIFEVDHLVPKPSKKDPRSRDPKYDRPLNKVVCCAGCNYNKGAWDPSGADLVPTNEVERRKLIAEVRERLRRLNERDENDWRLMVEDFRTRTKSGNP